MGRDLRSRPISRARDGLWGGTGGQRPLGGWSLALSRVVESSVVVVLSSTCLGGSHRPALTQPGHPHVVSPFACAGAVIPRTPKLSIAVTTMRPTLRMFFILTSVHPSGHSSPVYHCDAPGRAAVNGRWVKYLQCNFLQLRLKGPHNASGRRLCDTGLVDGCDEACVTGGGGGI